jgi:hypothetical protein
MVLWLWRGLVVLNILDIITTYFGLGMGATELNPIGFTITLLFKPVLLVIGLIGLIMIAPILKEDKVGRYAVYIEGVLANIGYIYIVGNNLNVLSQIWAHT